MKNGTFCCAQKIKIYIEVFDDKFIEFCCQLPIGHASKSLTEPQGNPDDYEYLCEDGSKVSVTGTACTWAQRPWQAYMGNGDINQKVCKIIFKSSLIYNMIVPLQQLERLQQRLTIFYDDSKTVDHQDVSYLWASFIYYATFWKDWGGEGTDGRVNFDIV